MLNLNKTVLPDPKENKTYYGLTTGIGLGSSGFEVHREWTNTIPIGEGFNIFDVAEKVYSKILEW